MLNKKFISLFLALTLIVLTLHTTIQADTPLWQDVAEATARSHGQRLIVPSAYRLVKVDLSQLQAQLATAPLAGSRSQELILELPLPDGDFGRFQVINAPIMEPELAAQYPQLQTYTAQGLDDPTATARLDLTPAGFHAYIQSADGEIYIDPYQTNDTIHYISYDKANFVKSDKKFVESVPDGARTAIAATQLQQQANVSTGETKRTYQLAFSASGEYADYICSQGGDCSNATKKRETAMAAIVTGMNRVTQIYERDLTISFLLVNNTDQLIYTDKNSDPYTNGSDADTLLDEFPTVINGVIAINDYDLGHVIGADGGGGVASPFTCGSSVHSDKASGATTHNTPTGDPFWVDYTAHEIGHQFNANHSYNASIDEGCNTRVGSVAYEPGGGTTIMSYAGICGGQDIQPNADAMFNAGAIAEIVAHVTTGDGSTCDDETAIGNTAPMVEAGNNYTIPKETPFRLTATVSDSEQASNALTTSWEQYTLGAAWTLENSLPNNDEQDNQVRPILRVFLPSSSPVRTIPSLANILDGTYRNNGEDLPSIDQTLTFRATIRDNVAEGGGVNSDDMQVTVEDNAGPFRVTSHATAATLGTNATTVEWNVANTNQAPVSCSAVDIALSTDGGVTFPHALATSTNNDGSESVTFPSVTTTQGRIQVKCSNNIFFDINKGNLTITTVVFDHFIYVPIVIR